MAGSSKLDQDAAHKVPTHLATRFLVENFGGAGVVRLSFGEQYDGRTTYFSAHQLSLEDALELHKVLGDVLGSQGMPKAG